MPSFISQVLIYDDGFHRSAQRADVKKMFLRYKMSYLLLLLMNLKLTLVTKNSGRQKPHHTAQSAKLNFLPELRHFALTLFILTIQSHKL